MNNLIKHQNIFDQLVKNKELIYELFCLATDTIPAPSDFAIKNYGTFVEVRAFHDNNLIDFIQINRNDLSIKRTLYGEIGMVYNMNIIRNMFSKIKQ